MKQSTSRVHNAGLRIEDLSYPANPILENKILLDAESNLSLRRKITVP